MSSDYESKKQYDKAMNVSLPRTPTNSPIEWNSPHFHVSNTSWALHPASSDQLFSSFVRDPSSELCPHDEDCRAIYTICLERGGLCLTISLWPWTWLALLRRGQSFRSDDSLLESMPNQRIVLGSMRCGRLWLWRQWNHGGTGLDDGVEFRI